MGSKKIEGPSLGQAPLLSTVQDQGQRWGLLISLFRCSEQTIFVLDRQCTIVDCSLSGEALLGRGRQELLGTSILDLSTEPEKLQSLVEQAEDNKVHKGDLALLHHDGSSVSCSLSLCPWLDQEGARVGYVAAATDNSTWFTFQDDLVHIDRLAEMGRMAAGIVHDLKNPLSVINQAAGWGGVVIDDAKGLGEEDRKELRDTLLEIEEQTNRCKLITNQILDYVRETGPRKESFDLQELIDETVRYMHPELKYPPIEVATVFAQRDVTLHSDAQLLQQVLVNLLSNAVHAVREVHTKEGGMIELRVNLSGETVHISVLDNGPGIDQSKLDNIFDFFYTTKPPGQGTGLGLPICKKIIHSLDGALSVESRPGKGATFTIALPGHQSHLSDQA